MFLCQKKKNNNKKQVCQNSKLQMIKVFNNLENNEIAQDLCSILSIHWWPNLNRGLSNIKTIGNPRQFMWCFIRIVPHSLEKLCQTHMQKQFILKGKNSLPLIANCFVLEQSSFQKGLEVQERKPEITKIVFLVKTGGKTSNVSYHSKGWKTTNGMWSQTVLSSLCLRRAKLNTSYESSVKVVWRKGRNTISYFMTLNNESLNISSNICTRLFHIR